MTYNTDDTTYLLNRIRCLCKEILDSAQLDYRSFLLALSVTELDTAITKRTHNNLPNEWNPNFITEEIS